VRTAVATTLVLLACPGLTSTPVPADRAVRSNEEIAVSGSQRSHTYRLFAVTLSPLLALASCVLACGRGAPPPPNPANQPGARTTGYAAIGSVKLYYEVHGAGPALLLMHGGLSSSEEFRQTIPAFASHFRVVVIDRRGHGRSADTADPFSYAGMADETKSVLDLLKIDAVDALGFSDGGVVAYHLAVRYPALVRRVVAVGANHLVSGMTEEGVNWTRTRLTVEGIARDYPSVEQQYRKLNPQSGNYDSFLRKTRDLWLRDPYIAREELATIGVPVLFVVGDRDAIRIEHVADMYRTLKKAEMFVVPNATHFLLFEKPDFVIPMVLDFLRR